MNREEWHASNRRGKTLATRETILQAAKQSPTGRIVLYRFDRTEQKMVQDIITADMPADELVF